MLLAVLSGACHIDFHALGSFLLAVLVFLWALGSLENQVTSKNIRLMKPRIGTGIIFLSSGLFATACFHKTGSIQAGCCSQICLIVSSDNVVLTDIPSKPIEVASCDLMFFDVYLNCFSSWIGEISSMISKSSIKFRHLCRFQSAAELEKSCLWAERGLGTRLGFFYPGCARDFFKGR